jgi:hypothetical protein
MTDGGGTTWTFDDGVVLSSAFDSGNCSKAEKVRD